MRRMQTKNVYISIGWFLLTHTEFAQLDAALITHRYRIVAAPPTVLEEIVAALEY